MKAMNELKPCPSCGGKAKMWYVTANGLYGVSIKVEKLHGMPADHRQVRCCNCGLMTRVYKTPKGAYNAWNRRVDND